MFQNRGNVCDNLKVRGVHIDGGYREYIAVPESDCYLLPDSLSDQDAVMIEPTTIAIQSCTRAELEKDDMLLIYGAGALGSSILKIAHTICDHIIVADIMDDKLAEAREHGAQFTINAATEDFQAKVLEYTHGRGSTVSIDAACVKILSCYYFRLLVMPVVLSLWAFPPLQQSKPVPDHFQRAGCERFPPPK